MKDFIKRLNWSGFFIVFMVAFAGAMSRTQDATIYDSLIVFAIIGIPLAIPFLFLGMKEKNEK